MSAEELHKRLSSLPAAHRELLARLVAGRSKPAQRALSEPSDPQFDAEAVQAFRSAADRTKRGTRKFYNAINRQLSATIFGDHSAFLNYGYIEDGSPTMSRIAVPADMVNKRSVKLVLEVVGDCELRGRRVLDVGCGRGGSIMVLNRLFDTPLKAGLDLSSDAIAFCHRVHRFPATYFLEGDSERLPFRDDCWDVVLNVESSHSYPAIDKFYAEVSRVLRLGGHFLYTDVFAAASWREHLRTLAAFGFEPEHERDITSNVVLACRETARLRSQVFEGIAEGALIEDFLSTPGSSVFAAMESGAASYRIYRLRKRGSSDSDGRPGQP